MKATSSGGVCVAGLLVFGASIVASAAGQSSTQPQAGSASSMDQITVTGCVQREADYRKAMEAGRGGVAGTGVGTGNEFVLTDVSKSSGASGSARSGEAGSPTGTAGSAAMAYELTGPNEGQVGAYVGRRVEISGKLKPAETSAGGTPTGGATAGAPPSGVDVTTKDLKLREFEVTSVRESTGACTPMK